MSYEVITILLVVSGLINIILSWGYRYQYHLTRFYKDMIKEEVTHSKEIIDKWRNICEDLEENFRELILITKKSPGEKEVTPPTKLEES